MAEEEYKAGDDKDILQRARDELKLCVDEESPERALMLDDINFCTLDQWPKDIRNERENDLENGPRPCLTIDKINQYIVQVVNDMRQGKPGINVRPQDDRADVQTAKVLKGIIRNIEDQSSADIAYATAGESAAKIGLGYFRIMTEYLPGSWDQDIFIRPIPNTFSVYLGKHFMPDGSDAKCGFILEATAVESFKSQYPGKKYKAEEFDGLGTQMTFWHTGEAVTVIEYFWLERINETLHFLSDGTTITKDDYDKWPAQAGARPSIQESRPSYREKLHWAKMTGVEVLEKRDLPGKYIPIVEVIGRESNIQGKRYLWGLVRPAKDSLRMYNYWASTITEKMGLAPKAPYIMAEGQDEGHEQEWRTANRKNSSRLVYKDISVAGNQVPPPKRQEPAAMEAAMFHFMQVIEHDVQTSLGMFKAATGESESQQSGRAILALQRESDTGTYHFGANQGISIRHAGRIILDWIPHYYDTKRVVRILGEDGEIQTAHIDPNQDVPQRQVQQDDGGIKNIYNPTIGKYDISISVGPSYNTKRMEAAATFVEMAKGAADPASAAILRYLVMRNSDSAGADEAAKLLKTMLPPQALQSMESKEPIPPQVQAMMQQIQQKMQMMQEEGAKLQQENVQLKAGAQVQMQKISADQQAQAQKISADQQASQAEFALQKQKQDGELQLQREKAMAEIELKRAIAVAELELERMKLTEGANADVEGAIAKVKAMVAVHETKIHGELSKAVAGKEEKSAQPDVAGMQQMHNSFLDAVGKIVDGLKAKKKVSMTLPDGRTASAQVSMQQ